MRKYQTNGVVMNLEGEIEEIIVLKLRSKKFLQSIRASSRGKKIQILAGAISEGIYSILEEIYGDISICHTVDDNIGIVGVSSLESALVLFKDSLRKNREYAREMHEMIEKEMEEDRQSMLEEPFN